MNDRGPLFKGASIIESRKISPWWWGYPYDGNVIKIDEKTISKYTNVENVIHIRIVKAQEDWKFIDKVVATFPNICTLILYSIPTTRDDLTDSTPYNIKILVCVHEMDLNNVGNKFQRVEQIYCRKQMKLDKNIRLPEVHTFSAIAGDGSISMLEMPMLEEFDMYTSNLNSKTTFHPHTLRIRYESLEFINVDRCKCLQLYSGNGVPSEDFAKMLAKVMPDDLIIGSNLLSFESIKKMYRPKRIGIYHNDVNIEEYVERFNCLNVYDASMPQRVMQIQKGIAHCNFDIFNNMWEVVIDRKIMLREIHVRGEIVIDSTNWSSLLKKRTNRTISLIGDTLTVGVTQKTIPELYESTIKLISNVEQYSEFKNLVIKLHQYIHDPEMFKIIKNRFQGFNVTVCDEPEF